MVESMKGKVDVYRKAKRDLHFFDCNLWWDSANSRSFVKYDSFEGFYNSLKENFIEKAILTTAESNRYDTKTGNEALKKLIAGKDNLYGAMVLTADHTITGENIVAYIDEMVAAGFVMVRVFSRQNRHPLKKSSMGDVFAHLNSRHIPLMIWHAEASWDAIESLCSEYPDMPVILEGNDMKLLYHNRFYIPLFKKYPNFYIETHNLVLFKEIDILAGMHPEKLVFGTYGLYNAPDAAMSQIVFGDMDVNTRYMIAHGNLERLIAFIR